jgi:hypothetical protein
MENARNLDFEIEVSYGKGGVRSKDKATGESFTGTYVAVAGGRVSIGAANTTIGRTNATTVSGGSVANTTIRPTNASTITTSTTREIMATSSALLFGDKGTVLDCGINIERGHMPKGIGACVDQQGVNYKLMF